MNTIGHGLSRRGLDREHNEDLWLCRDDIGLYAVADGMGDDGSGAQAATLALAALQREVEARLGADTPMEVVLQEAIECANSEVHALAQRLGRRRQLACSLTAVLASEGSLVVGSLGDTRAYLVRDGVVPLTRDHTLGAELALTGRLTEEESWSSSHRHILTRAVGMAPVASPGVSEYPMTKGDRVLLATNGVYRSETGARSMWHFLEGASSQDAAEHLVNAALASSEGDDRTVLLIDVLGDLPTEADAVRYLQAHPVFEDTPMSHLVQLRAVGRMVKLLGPTQLAKAGDDLSTMFVVIQGAIIAREGEDRTLYGVGSVVGYSRLVRTAKVHADLSCDGPLQMVAIDQKSFRAMVLRRPWVGLLLMFALTAWLADHTDPI